MDIATIIGLVGCAGAVVYGIVSGDLGFAALGNFWDYPSFLIVIVGCLMCMLTIRQHWRTYKLLKVIPFDNQSTGIQRGGDDT